MAGFPKPDQVPPQPELKKRDWTPLSPDIVTVITIPLILVGVLFFMIRSAPNKKSGAGIKATQEQSHGYVSFAMSTPYHLDDFDELVKTLLAERIRSPGSEGNLGTLSLLVESKDFDRAKQVSGKVIGARSLTVRIHKDADSKVWEVFESGKKVRDDSY